MRHISLASCCLQKGRLRGWYQHEGAGHTLARSVSLSQSTASGSIERLKKRGLVDHKRSKHDGRSVVVTLTSEGSGELDDVPSLLQDRFRRELVQLEEWEQTQILAGLQRLAAMMDADAIDAAPILETGLIGSDPDPEPANRPTRSGPNNF